MPHCAASALSYWRLVALNSKTRAHSSLFQATTSSLLESEADLFNSSYVPNNPGGLILDTALWKNTSEPTTNQIEKNHTSSPLVHLQPILVEQNTVTNEENFFLSTDEGMS